MPQGILCNNRPVNSKERIMELMGDTGGKKYYKEMETLDVSHDDLGALIKKTCKSRIRTWLEICNHCGLCADSCFFYLTNNKDPKQTPSYKIQSTLGELVRRKGKVDAAFMINAMDTAWGKCTCCNRCGLYCPHGIDMGAMFSYLRGLLFSQGFVPFELKIGSGMHRVYRGQMDVTTEDWVDTCEWMADEYGVDYPGLEIPIDKPNADIIYTLNAREPKFYPEDVAEMAILFQMAGENWTVPSVGWEETSLTMFAGDWEGCKMQVETVYDAIERLKPKRMVVTECGHAYRGTVVEGPYYAGLESGKTPVETLHYVEWVAEALREGKIKIDPAKKIKEPVTIQDACNYVRNGGLEKCTREIASYLCEEVIEMEPHGEHAFCCGGGGGLNGLARYGPERKIGFKNKRDQVLATGCKFVLTPCHNCWDAIRDMEEAYHIGIKWSFLKPLLIKAAIMPDHMKLKEE
ncbi:MAG: (Fe-S)-binding protein [Desulfobulbaceae bacterium]|nr:(Fe-S)-binding protein [Desulfobulbaceae bacterium]